jgi:hypothetical protein
MFIDTWPLIGIVGFNYGRTLLMTFFGYKTDNFCNIAVWVDKATSFESVVLIYFKPLI